MHPSRSVQFARLLHFAAAAVAAPQALSQEAHPEEVIVTATPLREAVMDITQPASVLSGDELRRRIAASIGESIASQPGVSASYFGPIASRPVIRGLGGERVLMLQNGVSALDVSSLSQDHAAAVEPVLADQIEILKGPAALLFGSGAVGGAVNVVDGRIPSRFSEDANRIALEIRGDTASDEHTGVARIDFGSDALRMHVDGFRRDTADLKIPGYALSAAERAEHLQDDPAETFARGVLENSDSSTTGGALGASVGHEDGFIGLSWSRFETNYGVPSDSHHGSDVGPEEPHGHGEDVRVDMQQDRYDLQAERRISLGALNRVRLRGAYSDYAHRELEGAEVGTRFEQNAYDLRLTFDHTEIAGWRGAVGAQYILLDFTASGAEAFAPPSKTRQAAAFVFEKRDFGALTLEWGARAEHQRVEPELQAPHYDGTAVSLSTGAVWRFSEDHALTLQMTRSQRHPQSAELYADGPHLAIGRYETGVAALGKETANTIDLSLHRHADEGVHWSGGVFYNAFGDYIYTQSLGREIDGLPLYAYTQADARFYGFEGEIAWPMYAQGSTQVEIRLVADYVRGKLRDGGDLPQIPPLRYGLQLHYERDRLHAGLEAYVYGDQKKTAGDERPTDGYTMLDADISYRLPIGREGLLMFLRGSNLLNEEARRHTSPLKEIAPLPGRSAHFGLRVQF